MKTIEYLREEICMKGIFNAILNDPESLKIYKETIVKTTESGAVFEVDYGAKNEYGA